MLLGKATGPSAWSQIPQGFGLADTPEGIAHHRLDDIQRPKCDSAIRFDPEAQVLEEFRLEGGDP